MSVPILAPGDFWELYARGVEEQLIALETQIQQRAAVARRRAVYVRIAGQHGLDPQAMVYTLDEQGLTLTVEPDLTPTAGDPRR